MVDIYNPLKRSLPRGSIARLLRRRGTSPSGMRWAAAGGESEALEIRASLVVDGIEHVTNILELAESGLFGDVPFIEAWACTGGCLGGPLTVQDPFLARYHLAAWFDNKAGEAKDEGEGRGCGSVPPVPSLAPRPGMRLDAVLKWRWISYAGSMKWLRNSPGLTVVPADVPIAWLWPRISSRVMPRRINAFH